MNKRLITLLLALCLMLSLVACGGSTTEEAPEQDVVEEETMPEEEVTEGDVTEEAPEVEETPEVEPEQAPVETPDAQPEQKPVETPEVEAPPAEAPAGSVDLSAFHASLFDTYGEEFNAVMNMCDSMEMLDGFYPGLSAIDTKQMMVYQPMMGAVVCEIALVEVTNSADVETVKGILQNRITTQVEGGAWYPESIEGWEKNSRIAVNGNYVMMIAHMYCDDIVTSFNGLF